MEKLIAFIGIAVVVIAMVLGIYWLLWLLWCWVLPQVWEGGPKNVIAPGYWLFAACWCLVTLLGKAIFGRAAAK